MTPLPSSQWIRTSGLSGDIGSFDGPPARCRARSGANLIPFGAGHNGLLRRDHKKAFQQRGRLRSVAIVRNNRRLPRRHGAIARDPETADPGASVAFSQRQLSEGLRAFLGSRQGQLRVDSGFPPTGWQGTKRKIRTTSDVGISTSRPPPGTHSLGA